MKIDLTALLSGKLTSLLKTPLPGEQDFTEVLNEKQQETLDNLDTLPDIPAPLIAEAWRMPLPLPAPALSWSPVRPERVAPAAVSPVMAHEDNPRWQLQNWVNHNAPYSSAPEPAPTPTPTLTPTPTPTPTKVSVLAEPSLRPTTEAPATRPEANVVTPVVPATGEERGAEPTQLMPGSTLLVTPSLRPLATPPLVMTAVVHHPPESSQWKQEVSQHIATLSRNGVHSAEIRLHPESLGSLHISLRVQQEQAQIHIVSEHAVVRQAMEQALPQLRAALAESGVQLAQTSISAESANTSAGDRRGSPAPQQTPPEISEHNNVDDESVNISLMPSPGNSSAINTFA